MIMTFVPAAVTFFILVALIFLTRLAVRVYLARRVR